jgi:TolB-like protein/DNA-binding winged helix-turn-helix (wHTH) protein/Tfp pilus assembly protein PilF
MATPTPNIYEFSGFQLDPAKRRLRRLDGTAVPLTSRVFDTLLFMVEHHDAVLDKERIMEAVWPDSIVEENNLAQAISKLRQVFGETPGSHSYIVTVPGRGYRFVAEVNRLTADAACEPAAEGATSEEPIQKSTTEARDEMSSSDRLSFKAPTIERGRPAPKADWLWITAISAVVILGFATFFFVRYRARNSSAPPATLSHAPTPIPEKSIAVLPFDNLSDQKENAYFAAGVQDEITSNLARIADLKVISRTSANLYKSGNPRNSREIGQQLGVAHLLEGNVQRIGNRLRVNAQLIKARSDSHVWAQTYDRDVSDLFAIQSELAQAIARQLYAEISPAEKRAIERAPTADLAAFDLYTRAKDLSQRSPFTNTGKKDLLQAADLLNQAIARDPEFFQAYCQLAFTHDYLYFFGHDRTPERRARAEAAIEAAFQLHPDAGEAHLARAENLYRGYLGYDGALAELEVARQSLPNDAHLFQLMGSIDRRRGRWEESTRSLKRAIELDPRNIHTLQEIAGNYAFLRRYAEAKSACERALAIAPDDIESKLGLADVEFDWKADTRPLHQLIDSVRATNPAALPDLAGPWFVCALAERDPAAAKEAVAAAGQQVSPGNQVIRFNRSFAQGVIARMMNDEGKAQSAFMIARAQQEKIVQAQPEYAPPLVVLGLIDAALGRKEDALREARRAVELLPVEKDSINGPTMIEYLAMVAAWVGENDLACENLSALIRHPGSVGYGQLKLLPFWDPLRGDPRFEQILTSVARK